MGREKSTRGSGILERARSGLGWASARGLEQLRRAGDQLAGAVGSAAGRLKESPAGERMGEALGLWRVLRHAAEAESRGDFAQAFALLAPEVARRGDDAKLAAAFWRAAVACDRPAEAAVPLARSIRLLIARGDVERAASRWSDLVSIVPDARVDAAALVRMVPVLRDRDPALARTALRHALDERSAGLTPGLAVRAAEYARELDPPTALRAVQRALGASGLHEERRSQLHGWLAQLERAARQAPRDAVPPAVLDSRAPPPPGAAPRATSASLADFADLLVDEALAAAAPAARFGELKVMEATPHALGDDALELRIAGGRRARLEYEKIQALAAVQLTDPAAGGAVVVDLALDWHEEGGGPLRVVRLHTAQFDPAALLDEALAAEAALRKLLRRLLERSGAVPLPDAALLDGPLRTFSSAAAYQREVLLVAQ